MAVPAQGQDVLTFLQYVAARRSVAIVAGVYMNDEVVMLTRANWEATLPFGEKISGKSINQKYIDHRRSPCLED